MPVITQHVPTVIVNSLRGFGFDIGTNETCKDFLDRLRDFISLFCQYYEDAVSEELKHPECEKTAEEITSWAINETTHILFDALGRYRDKIANHEAIDASKIGCSHALGYFVWLMEITESVKESRLESYQTEPRSTKFRKKRKAHRWTPYTVDVVFTEIKRRFSK